MNQLSITDLALRRPNSHVHLFERYFTGYWKVLVSIITGCSIEAAATLTQDEARREISLRKKSRFVAPLVSRHIDFLESLIGSGVLGVDESALKGNFLLIYICNFHVLSHLLLIYICKLHWNCLDESALKECLRETVLLLGSGNHASSPLLSFRCFAPSLS